MRKILVATLIGLLPLATASAEDADVQARVQTSKAAIKDFAGNLKGQLEAAMKEGGPIKAIGVCNTVAPVIAKTKSEEHKMHIARTSLKARNEGNAPDAWEKAVLEKFEARKAAGEAVDEMAYSEVVEKDGAKQFRFMKAIPTGEVCLKCHGGEIAPEVAAKLDELYPKDQARGYKLGDIRGAFTITQKM